MKNQTANNMNNMSIQTEPVYLRTRGRTAYGG